MSSSFTILVENQILKLTLSAANVTSAHKKVPQLRTAVKVKSDQHKKIFFSNYSTLNRDCISLEAQTLGKTAILIKSEFSGCFTKIVTNIDQL